MISKLSVLQEFPLFTKPVWIILKSKIGTRMIFCYWWSDLLNFFYFNIYLSLEKGEEREKERERNIDVREIHWLIGFFLHSPNWGPGPEPRHVPWPGIKPVTLWFAGWYSIHWATPARAKIISFSIFFFLKGFIYFLERGGGREKGGGKTSMCERNMIGCLLHALQLRHVPWLGIELATFQFAGQYSTHCATPARAKIIFLSTSLMCYS